MKQRYQVFRIHSLTTNKKLFYLCIYKMNKGINISKHEAKKQSKAAKQDYAYARNEMI